jgi:uncharacterized Tic20 family protein
MTTDGGQQSFEDGIPPPGWYDDGTGSQRYWTGRSWANPVLPGSSSTATARMSSSDETTIAMLIHVLSLVTGVFGPLVIWLLKRDQSDFVDAHGREAINFQVTLYIAAIVSFLLMFVLIGFLLLAALFVLQFLMPLFAALMAAGHRPFRYPFTIRLL